MKLIPAIDLKEGKCVRLSRGKQNSSVIYNDSPVKQAQFFEKEGCKRIHIIDLDAAFGNKINNKSIILDIRNSVSIDIELGGGIRTAEDLSFWIKNGINFIIVGSLATKDPENLIRMANFFPEKLYISLDDHNGKIMIHGWVKESGFNTNQIISIYNNTEIKGFIFTDVTRDGMLEGIDTNKLKDCLKLSKKPLIVGGGLSNNNDLLNLLNLNNSLLEGVIAGKSFYSGKIKIKTALKLLD